MLAEIAIANAAFGVLKQAFNNGKDIVSLGSELGSYFSAADEVNKKPSSQIGSGNALEAWQDKQTIKKQREQLKFMLNKQQLQGWTDFVKFEAEWHRERKDAAKAEHNKKIRRNAAIQENVALGMKVMVGLLIAIASLFGVALYMRHL